MSGEVLVGVVGAIATVLSALISKYGLGSFWRWPQSRVDGEGESHELVAINQNPQNDATFPRLSRKGNEMIRCIILLVAVAPHFAVPKPPEFVLHRLGEGHACGVTAEGDVFGDAVRGFTLAHPAVWKSNSCTPVFLTMPGAPFYGTVVDGRGDLFLHSFYGPVKGSKPTSRLESISNGVVREWEQAAVICFTDRFAFGEQDGQLFRWPLPAGGAEPLGQLFPDWQTVPVAILRTGDVVGMSTKAGKQHVFRYLVSQQKFEDWGAGSVSSVFGDKLLGATDVGGRTTAAIWHGPGIGAELSLPPDGKNELSSLAVAGNDQLIVGLVTTHRGPQGVVWTRVGANWIAHSLVDLVTPRPECFSILPVAVTKCGRIVVTVHRRDLSLEAAILSPASD